eukprot:COSAG01_NODE_73954_length_232_cov_9.030075_1_plen_54_part_10
MSSKYEIWGSGSAWSERTNAVIVSARFDDYAYQILKNNDYALHCGMQAPRSVLL